MAGNIPKFYEGGLEGYGAWLIGDDSHQRLTRYHEGEKIELDEYELDFLNNFTHPKSTGVLVYEDWSEARRRGVQGQNGTLNFYMTKDQLEERWDIARKNHKPNEEESRLLGMLGLTGDLLSS